MWRLWTCAVLATFLALSPTAARALDDSMACGAETARQEKLQAIPDRLLHAISLAESGRWDADHRASFAWPWTVMAEGEGRFLPNKAAAIAEVKGLQARGVRNIDVGCMQVNLQAHPDAFASLDEAFEPATNVAYAGRFLMGLYDSTQNWPTAAAYYHSQTPELALPYKTRLMAIWEQSKRRSDDRPQLAALQSASPPPLGLLIAVAARQETADGPAAAPVKPPAGLGATKAAALARSESERIEAKRIADAYRQARLEEYRMRKAQMGHS